MEANIIHCVHIKKHKRPSSKLQQLRTNIYCVRSERCYWFCIVYYTQIQCSPAQRFIIIFFFHKKICVVCYFGVCGIIRQNQQLVSWLYSYSSNVYAGRGTFTCYLVKTQKRQHKKCMVFVRIVTQHTLVMENSL